MPAPIPREQLLDDLQQVTDKLNKTPTQREYQEHGNHSAATLGRKFGGFNKALAAIDHEPNKVGEVSIQELLSDIERVANRLGETPTADQYTELGDYHHSSVTEKFGKWNQAVEELDLEPNKIPNIPEKDLLDDLESVSQLTGGTPTRREYNKQGTYSANTIRTRLGWQEAIKSLGLEPNYPKRSPPSEACLIARSPGDSTRLYSDETLLNSLAKHADGRLAPSLGEYRENGKYNAGTIKNRFGSWWKAVVKAGVAPSRRRPLRPYLHHELYEIAIDSAETSNAVYTLIFLFTGMPRGIVSNFTQEWIADRRDRHIVRVPPKYTDSNQPWLFRIPEQWYDPYIGEMRPTHLPSLLDWYWNFYDCFPKTGVLKRHCLTIGQGTALENLRNTRFYAGQIGVAPQIRTSDLRVTYGINLALQNVDSESIRQQLGMNHLDHSGDVEDYFLWNYVYHGHIHPDYSPPNTTLDPVQ